jgi:hypothetical protein
VDLVGRYSNPQVLLERIRRLLDLPSGPGLPAPGRPGRQRQKRLNPDEVDRLVEDYAQGATIAQLAGSFSVHRTTVLGQLRHAGAERRTGVVDRNIEEAARLYGQGWSLARVGHRLGVDAETVRQAFHRANIAVRQRRGHSPATPQDRR